MASDLMDPPQTPGGRIRYVRDFQRGMTQQQVVDAMRSFGIAVDTAVLSRIERGERMPTAWQAIGLVAVLGATPDDLGLTRENYPQLDLLTSDELMGLLRDISHYLSSTVPPAAMAVA